MIVTETISLTLWNRLSLGAGTVVISLTLTDACYKTVRKTISGPVWWTSYLKPSLSL